MEFVDYADSDMLMLSLAQRLSRELREALARRERALIALPGGTTPGPLFDLLAAADLDWSRVDILPGDERCVPPGHPRSNAGQIAARLMQGKAAAATLIPLWPIPEGLEALLPLDLALVGMGNDMHTASLFPGAPELGAALAPDAPAALTLKAAGAPEPRATLSARVLRGAFAVHVLILGADKRAALDRAQTLPADQAPIAALLPVATVHWAP